MRADRGHKAQLSDTLRRLRAKLAAVVDAPATRTDENWRALDELATSEQRFRVIAAASRELVTETDSEGRFTYVNDACILLMSGYTRDRAVRDLPDELLAGFQALLSP